MTPPDHYQECVAEARTLVKRSEADQWRLAQLTWEQLEAGVRAVQWAADIGVDPSYVYRLRRIWEQHSSVDSVHKPRFTDAYKELVPSSHNPYVPLDQRPPEVETRSADEIDVAQRVADLPSVPDLLSIYGDLAAARRLIRSAFRLTVAADPADNVKMSLLDELGDIDTEVSHFRKFLAGMGVEEFIDQIMDGA